ncbi:MAG: porphobilinogen synthase [Alphaproteobacteria bacterium]|nr:porphobilinogen synthase [Alphaproteobacteria bacterium]
MTTLKWQHPMTGQFPTTRLRRNRQSAWLRDLVAETNLSEKDLIYPLFIRDHNSPKTIHSLPGVERYDVDALLQQVAVASEAKIPAICLFPYFSPDQRLANVVEMLSPENIYCEAIRRIKSNFPDMGVIADVALDCYTSHGQDGIVRDGVILNDETVSIISDYAITIAEAGADIIAPSEMMDGRIGAIRKRLDEKNFQDIAVMSYAAKYASNFYGPFRDAVGSKECLGLADKRSYQIDPRNSLEALREVAQDIAEGADMVIVKPGLPYLDVVKAVKDTYGVPTFAYQVSGEYAMLKAASQQGWLDFDSCLYETALSFKRAGADGILSYGAIELASLLKKGL